LRGADENPSLLGYEDASLDTVMAILDKAGKITSGVLNRST
jgi:hypothetical protein